MIFQTVPSSMLLVCHSCKISMQFEISAHIVSSYISDSHRLLTHAQFFRSVGEYCFVKIKTHGSKIFTILVIKKGKKQSGKVKFKQVRLNSRNKREKSLHD